MSISPGHTDDEIREFEHQYELQPARLRRWRVAVFEGDLARGLIPREGSPMTVPPKQRTALETLRARERDDYSEEVARLAARVRELEETNTALGKAIGLLHSMNEEEPAGPPTTPESPSS
jgi:hypothetical protein